LSISTQIRVAINCLYLSLDWNDLATINNFLSNNKCPKQYCYSSIIGMICLHIVNSYYKNLIQNLIINSEVLSLPKIGFIIVLIFFLFPLYSSLFDFRIVFIYSFEIILLGIVANNPLSFTYKEDISYELVHIFFLFFHCLIFISTQKHTSQMLLFQRLVVKYRYLLIKYN
jgi:hypothetical protein